MHGTIDISSCSCHWTRLKRAIHLTHELRTKVIFAFLGFDVVAWVHWRKARMLQLEELNWHDVGCGVEWISVMTKCFQLAADVHTVLVRKMRRKRTVQLKRVSDCSCAS